MTSDFSTGPDVARSKGRSSIVGLTALLKTQGFHVANFVAVPWLVGPPPPRRRKRQGSAFSVTQPLPRTAGICRGRNWQTVSEAGQPAVS